MRHELGVVCWLIGVVASAGCPRGQDVTRDASISSQQGVRPKTYLEFLVHPSTTPSVDGGRKCIIHDKRLHSESNKRAPILYQASSAQLSTRAIGDAATQGCG